MEDYILNLLVFGVISWSTLFVITRKVFPKRSFEFCNRTVSSIHAIIAVSLALFSIEDWRCPVCPLVPKPSQHQMRALAVTTAYLIYDLGCSFFDKKFKFDNAFHHVVCIVGIGAGLNNYKCISEMVSTLIITEISSPFLHMRELLKELGYKDTGLNLTADILFATIFSVARMVGGPYLSYVVLSGDCPFFMKALALALQLVSAYWFYKIVRMMIYKLSKRASSPSSKRVAQSL